MTGLARRCLGVFIAALLLAGGVFSLAASNLQTARAADPTPTPAAGPVRKAVLDANYTLYTWWLVRYSNNAIVCTLTTEHSGVPTADEVEGECSKTLAQEWQTSQPCNFAEKSTQDCPGLYFVDRGSQARTRKVTVELPLPKVWLEVVDCNPLAGEHKCSTLPSLRLRGEEPLPNETILSIQGTLNGEPFSCNGADCRIPMQPTGMDGASMEFWADSSFGDSTEHYTAKVRLIPWGDFMNPEAKTAATGVSSRIWYVDVLSSQWTGGELASCSSTWQVFPGLGGPPDWLKSPATVDELRSASGYYYLAAQLIQSGQVRPDACLDGGLTSANVASPCGVEAALPALISWQNRFDGEIFQAARDTGVPARLLKGVFARESQIWPGIFTTNKEAGLGQMTENGADTVLLWNPDFFHQFCPLVLSKATCDLGWGNLKAPEQNLLKGALVSKVNSTCPTCAGGVDLTQASYSVKLFAESLLANCEQVGQIERQLTGLEPGANSTYEDLWRFTLVNYNAGPGCLSSAIRAAQSHNEPLDWQHVSARLEPACQGAVGYVEDVSGMLKVAPTPTPWVADAGPLPALALPRVQLTPTARPTGLAPTPTPAATQSLSPSPSPTVTPTYHP